LNIYVCSPYRGNIQRNRRYASDCAAEIAREGHVPVAPHLLLTGSLDDRDPEQRQEGLQLALELMGKCDEVWIYAAYGISEGMAEELGWAWAHNIPMVFKATAGGGGL